MALPTGYTEVQYIQSTGMQYVDTEVKADQTYTLEVQYQTSQTSSGAIAVSDTNWQSNGFGIWCNAVVFGNQTSQDVTLNGSDIITVKLSQTGLVVNGKSVWVPSTATFNVVHNMALMALNRSGSISEKLTGKLYYAKISSGTSLIRNYIPCINPDGDAGLYDTVNSKFYGNAGTGVFFAGPPKVTLPSTYTQLEYILSSATQLIDTEVKPGNTTKVEIDFEPTALTSSHLMVLGTRNTSSGGNQFVIGWTGHKSPAVWRSDYGSSQVNFTTAITGVARHYAVKNGASCKIDTETVSNTAATFTSNYTLYLFGGNQAGTAVSQITTKLYRCKIYTSDQLVRDYIPCMNAAGAIGLYDLANSKFYANAGTGVFTAGPEVTWPSNDTIYVKVNGIWRQINGIKLL